MDDYQINQYRILYRMLEGDATTEYCVEDESGNKSRLMMTNRLDVSVFEVWKANILRQLNHPVAPRLLDSGIYGRHSYCVIELIEGESWGQKIAEAKSIDERQVIDWTIQICDFLIYLQELSHLSLHPILDPENIIVQFDKHVRVLNYYGMDYARHYKVNPIFGMSGFTPPEAYAGYYEQRSDIYMLGASLYSLLTKRHPLKAHAPFLFHFFPPRSLNPDISVALEAVILKAVEHKPEDRYPSAAAIREALEKCLE